MRKADAVLAVLAVAVLAAAAAGIAKSDDWTGERDHRFATSTVPASLQGPAPAGTAPATFEWAAPANATAVRLDVVVNFTGQSVQGGNAVVRVGGTAPDGTPLPAATYVMPVGGNNVRGGAVFAYNATWAQPREDVRDTREPAARTWDRPLVVRVAVERPADVPLATYAFTAQASGTFAVDRLA